MDVPSFHINETIMLYLGYLVMLTVFAFTVIPLYNAREWWKQCISGTLFYITIRLFIEWNQHLGVW